MWWTRTLRWGSRHSPGGLLACVADRQRIERRGLIAAETHRRLGDAIERVDVAGREVPDEKMAVPVGGKAHRVDRGWCRTLLALRGSHVHLLPADCVGRRLRDGLHAGRLVDDLRHVVEERGAFAGVLGVEAVDVEFGEKDGRVGCWSYRDLRCAIRCRLGFLRRTAVRQLKEQNGAKASNSLSEFGVGDARSAKKIEAAILQYVGGIALHEIGGIKQAQLERFVLPLGCVGSGSLCFGVENKS